VLESEVMVVLDFVTACCGDSAPELGKYGLLFTGFPHTKSAVIAWVGGVTARFERAQVATPAALVSKLLQVDIGLPFSEKLIRPTGVTPVKPDATPVVAVKVTVWPKTDGLTLLTTLVEVASVDG